LHSSSCGGGGTANFALVSPRAAPCVEEDAHCGSEATSSCIPAAMFSPARGRVSHLSPDCRESSCIGDPASIGSPRLAAAASLQHSRFSNLGARKISGDGSSTH
jgi:hypothetical protein